MYVNKIENRITFKIKTEYYVELLMRETGKNVPHLEITEVVLVHCSIVNNDYQQDTRFLCTFVPNKSFGQLLDISPKNYIFFKTFDPDFSCIVVWFTDQNCKPLEIEDKISITLVTNENVKYKKWCAIYFSQEIKYL